MKNKFLASADEALSAFRNENKRLRYAVHTSLYPYISRPKVRSLYNSGLGVKDLAGIYGCSVDNMRGMLRQAGTIFRGNYRHDIPQKIVAKRYLQGEAVAAMVKEYQTSESTIRKRIYDEGVERKKSIKKPKKVAPRPPQKKREPIPVEKAIRFYEKYGSIYRVAKELDVHFEYAKSLLADAGIKPQGYRTDITLKHAVQAYRSCGGDVRQAARKLYCSKTTLSARLVQAGEIEYESDLSRSAVKNILHDYDSGKAVTKIARDNHMAQTSLRLLLITHNRIPSRYKTLRIPLERIAERHEKGEHLYKLAEEAGIGHEVLSQKLRAAGYKVRLYNRRYELSGELTKKICRQREAGYSISQIAKGGTKYYKRTISRILRDNGYEIGQPHKRVFTPKEEKAIYKAYDTGTSLSALKLTYGLATAKPIRRVIVASGRRIRTQQEQRKIDWQFYLDKLLET